MSATLRELAVIVVSHDARRFLGPALRSLRAHVGEIDVEVVVVDNGSDGAGEFVDSEFPGTLTVRCPNRGFAHANNVGLERVHARYVLLLNPDTEILEGTLAGLVARLDELPQVGLAGVRQVTPSGGLAPTMRRFPSPARALGEALGPEWFPLRPTWMGERELRAARYDEERSCDWVSGSFMLIRHEALQDAGRLDERFFLYSEETDLCLRVKQAGWEVRHLPTMTILHHEGSSEVDIRLEAQRAFARVQYARKHFPPAKRELYRLALILRYGLRAAVFGMLGQRGEKRLKAALAGVVTAAGRAGPPFAQASTPTAAPGAVDATAEAP